MGPVISGFPVQCVGRVRRTKSAYLIIITLYLINSFHQEAQHHAVKWTPDLLVKYLGHTLACAPYDITCIYPITRRTSADDAKYKIIPHNAKKKSPSISLVDTRQTSHKQARGSCRVWAPPGTRPAYLCMWETRYSEALARTNRQSNKRPKDQNQKHTWPLSHPAHTIAGRHATSDTLLGHRKEATGASSWSTWYT